jgi:hydroxymethylpyrimidine pyrophosphatase-like HAD family hydrolase
MTWAMPVREDQARVSAYDYDGTVVHDGQLDEETMAEPLRLADIGRKLLLVTGRELGDLLEVFLTAGAVRASRG